MQSFMPKTIYFCLIFSNLTKNRSTEIMSVNSCFSHMSTQLSIQSRYKKNLYPNIQKIGFILSVLIQLKVCYQQLSGMLTE